MTKAKSSLYKQEKLIFPRHNGDGKYDGYDVDIDWYLANGYRKAEDMFKRIEGQLIEDGKDSKG